MLQKVILIDEKKNFSGMSQIIFVKEKPLSRMSQMQQIILFWDVSKIIPVKGKPFLESLKDYPR